MKGKKINEPDIFLPFVFLPCRIVLGALRYSSGFEMVNQPKLSLLAGVSLMLVVLGCQPETPDDGSASQADDQIERSVSNGSESSDRDAIRSVDPAVDAGMMADAIEHEQSMVKEQAIDIKSPVGTNPRAADDN